MRPRGYNLRVVHVLLAEPSASARSAMVLLLEQQVGIDAIDEAPTADRCLERLAQAATDLLVLDWRLPGQRAAELIRVLRSAYPELRILVISSRPEDGPSALSAGAHAFVSKVDAPDALLRALVPLSVSS